MGHPFFCCDAVLDTYSRQIAVFSGYAKVHAAGKSWKVANQRTYVPFAEEKYDVMVFGMPQNFHYGDGMGTNPIQMMQALSAQVIRHKRVMKENCVIICSSICNGYFHDERWPYLRELYEMFQHDSHADPCRTWTGTGSTSPPMRNTSASTASATPSTPSTASP